MAGYRDDSAGSYGQWNDDDLSWLDYLKAKGADIGGGAYNALANLTGALSPIGTSPEGNMSLQVPPMISGIADSYSRLAGTPSQPGNAYSLTGVPELDAPIQSDMSNVLLSLYGGNALNPLAKRPVGSVGAGMGEAAAQPVRAYHGTNRQTDGKLRPSPASYPQGPGLYAAIDDAETGFLGADRASGYAKDAYGNYDGGNVLPLNVDAKIAPYALFRDFQQSHVRNGLAPTDAKVAAQKDLLELGYGASNADGKLAIFKPGTVKSATTGETLFSDTGKPSIFGSAAATAGEQQPIRAYRGSNYAFGLTPQNDMPFFSSSSPDVASSYADVGGAGAVMPIDLKFSNPMTVDAGGARWDRIPYEGLHLETNDFLLKAKEAGHDGLIVKNVIDDSNEVLNPATTYAAIKRDTVKSPLTGETLFSDTGKPSIFGSAAATAGEQPNIPYWLKF